MKPESPLDAPSVQRLATVLHFLFWVVVFTLFALVVAQ